MGAHGMGPCVKEGRHQAPLPRISFPPLFGIFMQREKYVMLAAAAFSRHRPRTLGALCCALPRPQEQCTSLFLPSKELSLHVAVKRCSAHCSPHGCCPVPLWNAASQPPKKNHHFSEILQLCGWWRAGALVGQWRSVSGVLRAYRPCTPVLVPLC